ncbi:MAG: alpha/beta hydrolase, partial [Acidobacteria bacterium]|nr:alpha/beta hydrolase [Acidobacteriota bacterium]
VWIQQMTAFLEWASQPLANRWAHKLFFTPARKYRDAPEWPGLDQRQISFVNTQGKKQFFSAYAAGPGPSILLIHGWAGAAKSYETLGQHLIQAGYRVVSFDGPAHGTSPGSQTNLLEMSGIAQLLGQWNGPFQAVIGHSFGGVVAAHAIHNGLACQQWVLVSAPADIEFILDQFQGMIGAGYKTRQALAGRLQTLIQGPLNTISLANLLPTHLPGLLLHDREDAVIPAEHAQHLHQKAPDAKLVLTEGLGHSRILRHESSLNLIAEFLNQRKSPALLARDVPEMAADYASHLNQLAVSLLKPWAQ